MYSAYWNLKGNPFLNVIDRRFLFVGEQHQEAIARLAFLAENSRLAGVLVGPYGVGKSTLLRSVGAEVESRYRLPVLRLDAIPGGQLPMARRILAALKVDAPASTLPDALMGLAQAVEHRPDGFSRTFLCIDEAHYLAEGDGLYLVHYLSNLRIPPHKSRTEEPLFTVVLAGTPDLLPAIQALPSLAQRIQIVFSLSPLSESQTTSYVQQHMRTVGGDIWSFDRPALEAIYRISRGLPRKINLLCDTSLMLGYAAKASQVSADIVAQAALDTGLALSPPERKETAP